jgi:hypothetical protein
MSISRRIKRALRGDVSLNSLALEAVRLKRSSLHHKRERKELERLNNSPARLISDFNSLNKSDLLSHFRQRKTPSYFSNDDLTHIAKLQSENFPAETENLIKDANQIVKERCWSLLGFGELKFDAENFWRLDPIKKTDWGLEYHRDVKLTPNDGRDVRLLWELNRFVHALTLARAYTVTKDESFALEFFSQVKSWQQQNPYGRGANWACAMEVSLRAINLLAAFEIFRYSTSMNEERLLDLLTLFDQHGKFIFQNNEFSFISTSNHYLSDVVGLLWLGVLLPELQSANEWREFGLRETFREMDKQILADGVDYEASTGYHRLATELFLYSFLLCKKNDIEVHQKHWNQLRLMMEYIRVYLRPDGFAPLIGDTDGGQILPFVKRDAHDHAYLLALGAVVFEVPLFKTSPSLISEETLWHTGYKGVEIYNELNQSYSTISSRAFKHGGAYIMRQDDLYLYFNANDCGLNGRGSHGHNDALSIEVSAFGQPFIVDPGSYVYNLDLTERHLFRSTAYHSTVQVDDEEQNTTDVNLPFVIGNEARPNVLQWETTHERDSVSAEHHGYARLKNPVIHHRSIEFNKKEGYWLIEDKLSGKGKHDFYFRFHLAPYLNVSEDETGLIRISDKMNRRLFLKQFGLNIKSKVNQVWVSRNYGQHEESSSICWEVKAGLPLKLGFVLIPLRTIDNEASQKERLKCIIECIKIT